MTVLQLDWRAVFFQGGEMDYFLLNLMEILSMCALISLLGFGGYFFYKNGKDQNINIHSKTRFNKRAHRTHRKKYGYLRNFDINTV